MKDTGDVDSASPRRESRALEIEMNWRRSRNPRTTNGRAGEKREDGGRQKHIRIRSHEQRLLRRAERVCEREEKEK